MNKELVNSNYILRLFFMFMILSSHCTWMMENTSYYIAVDYFLMISGIMIVWGCDRKEECNVWTYTWGRIKKLYPHVLFSFITLYIYMHGFNFRGIYRYAYQIIPGLWYVLPNDMAETYLNYPVWYVSLLIVGSHIVYYLYCNHSSLFTDLICPITVIGGWGYFVKKCGTFNNGDSIGVFFNGSYLRTIIGLFCGVILYRLIKKVASIPFCKWFVRLCNATEIFLVVFLFLLVKKGPKYDIFFIIIICAIIILSFVHKDEDKYFFQRFRRFNDLMYPVYLNHVLVLTILSECKWFTGLISANKVAAVIVFFVFTSVYSLIT